MSLIAQEAATKRLIQLDKSNLTALDNKRQDIYNEYSSIANGHISTTGLDLILAQYACNSVAVPSDIVWHYEVQNVADPSVTVTVPTGLSFKASKYAYGHAQAFMLNKSIDITVREGANTLVSANLYSLEGTFRVIGGQPLFSFVWGFHNAQCMTVVWTDEFVVPNLVITIEKGWYAV